MSAIIMKRVHYILLWGILLLLLLFGNARYVEAGEAFYITSYAVTVQVSQDNVYHIQEDIGVNFTAPRHGIYRNIPIYYTVSREDGSSNRIHARVSNVSCNDPYKTSFVGEDYRIQIGNEDETQIGSNHYSISYDLSVGKDPLKDKDEFYYNIIGTEWDTTISDVTFTVIMPSTIDQEKFGLSYGYQGSTSTDGLQYQINDNMVTGNLDPSIVLRPRQGITMRMEFPDGYFTYHQEFPLGAVISIVMVTLAMVLAFMLWHHYGKEDLLVGGIEFYPPTAMNSLETALAYKGKVDGEDVVSLIVYLASKGYLSISETSKGDFVLHKIKEYDGNNRVEQILFNSLFPSMDFVTKYDLEYKFYSKVKKIKGIMNSKQNSNVLFYENSTNKDFLLILMAIGSIILSLYHSSYEVTGSVYASVMSSLILGVVLVLTMRTLMKPGSLFQRTQKAWKNVLAFGFFGLACFIVVLQDMIYADSVYRFACVYGILGCLVILFFRHNMPRRTDYGKRILAYLQGFREFLQTAEKDKLETLVEEDPQYFYSILPYAYVLGVSDIWMKKFEFITMDPPKWYHSSLYSTFYMAGFQKSMGRTIKVAGSAMNSSPWSGGFSGGGHGGGGGGSW